MSGSLLMGVDVGTSSLKLVITDPTGRVLRRSSASYKSSHPGDDLAEQDPYEWWSALCKTTRNVLDDGIVPSDIGAMCLSTQGGTLVPVTGEYEPAVPAILWSDSRCRDESEELIRLGYEELVYRESGWPLTSGLNLLQVIRLKQRSPETANCIARYLSVHDYLAYRLTGRAVLDPSNAGINQLGGLVGADWSSDLLSLAKLDSDQLGTLLPAGEVIGTITPQAARETGLSTNTVLVNGAHDQYCVAYGLGANSVGDVFVGSGTAWVVGTITDSLTAGFSRNQCVSRHVVDGLFGNLISLESGGASLEWWRNLISLGGKKISWADIDRNAPPDPMRFPLFLPYLFGSSYPTNDPDARASLWKIQANHSAFDIAAAIMAGVAMQTAWTLESFPAHAEHITLVGGAANSPVWSQYLADATNRPVLVATERDAGALGAALLAGKGLGVTAVPKMSQLDHEFVYLPSEAREHWAQRSAEFRRLSTQSANTNN